MEYELYHHGIKGMKWGIRRYQNKDGSLTPAGEKRRAKLEGKLDKLGGPSKKKTADDSDNVQPAKKKTASEMDDNELSRAINRARMEDEYRRLRPEPQPVEKNAFAKQLVNDMVKPALINSGRQFLQNTLNKAAENILKGKADPDSIDALKKTYEKLDYKQKIDKMLNPDKYLSEEDKNKRQEREFKSEDRAARKEGYNDAADKAVKTREAEEAARKAKADAEARTANEPKSNEYYNAMYRNKGVGEKTSTGQSEPRDLVLHDTPVTSLSKTTVSSGKSFVDSYANDSYYELIDRDGSTILSWGGSDD